MGPPRIAVVSAVASVISVIAVVASVIAQVTNDPINLSMATTPTFSR